MAFNKAYIVLVSLFFAIGCFGQAVIKGKVSDNYGVITGADVFLEGTSIGTQTNQNGFYELPAPAGNYTLVVSYTGFKTIKTNITTKNNQTIPKNFTIESETNSLSNVEVVAKTEVDIIKEKDFEVEVIETKELKNNTIDVNSVLEKIPGVNIRQTGGVGSSFNFSLNGLSGRKVKFFIDGISLDSYGSSLSLNNFPASLVERVEVYKGVTPIYLGTDTLGGAINIVTNQSTRDLIDFSYSYGSFNTNLFAINLNKVFNEKWVLKVSSFYNYSDNNYKVDDIPVFDDLGNSLGTANNLERFHDAYQSQLIDVKAGVINRKYADELLIGFSVSSNLNEVQHSDGSMINPYGEVTTENATKKIGLFFTKDDLFNKKLKIKFLATIGENKEAIIDTSSRVYDWFGNSTVRRLNDIGELGSEKTLFSFTDNIHFLNFSTEYKLFKNDKLSFNYIKDFIEREGSDPLKVLRISPFEEPNSVNKNIFGLSYNVNLFENKWSSTFFVKQLFSNLKGIFEDSFTFEQSDYINKTSNTGFGIATSFKINNSFQFKTSFEKTYRIPDGYEFFGDGLNIQSNLELEIEESQNVNIGTIYNYNFKDSKLGFDSNLFYRKSNDFIRPIAATVTKIQYQNLKDVSSYGAEIEFTFSHKNKFQISTNATYQRVVDTSLDNVRVANIPYLFGNLSTGYNLYQIFKDSDKLTASWNSFFVHEFPYQSYVSGNEEDRLVVPQQLTHNIELTYSLYKGKYNFSFLTKNLFDSKVYDNFSLQQPGRSFYFKIRYSLN